MPDITASAAQVGETILQALQTALGLGPEAALAQAKADNGVTTEDIDNADMGDVLGYMCGQPDLSPQLQSFLTGVSNNYGSGNSVHQGGSSFSGGGSYGGGGGGGGAAAGGAASNSQLVNQVTNNYYSQEINDNSSDTIFSGNFAGDIDVDNDHVNVDGDGNAVNTGEGDQNAATGDGSQVIDGDNFGNANTGDGAAQASSVTGDAQANTGDGAVQVGGDNEGPVNTGVNTGVINDNGTVEDVVVGDGNNTANVEGSTADGSVFNFGDGDVDNASNNTVSDGAVSAGGDATNTSNNSSDDDLFDDKDLFDDRDLLDDKDVIDVDSHTFATQESAPEPLAKLSDPQQEQRPAEELLDS